jgi:hypothetical protein
MVINHFFLFKYKFAHISFLHIGDVALGFCAYRRYLFIDNFYLKKTQEISFIHSKVRMGNSLDELGRERFHPLGNFKVSIQISQKVQIKIYS